MTEAFRPTAESVSRHIAPDWWRDAKFGVLISWGPAAVPAFAEPADSFFAFAEWYWFYQQLEPGELQQAIPELAPGADTVYRDHHRQVYGESVRYDDLVERWRAESWNPADWIELFESAGAKYFVLVAKHHDGVALWPTATSDRHSGALGPRRDIVGELLEAAADSSLRTGLFYAMAEWFSPAPHPDQLADPEDPLFDLAFNRHRRARDAYTGEAVEYLGYRPVADYAADVIVPQVTELIERYTPSILWFDLPGDAAYAQADRLIADFYNVGSAVHPEGVVVNDRAGIGAHGDFHTFEYGHHPSAASADEPFEAAHSMGASFGYNALETADHYSSSAALIDVLVEVVSEGGNLLLNVGPRADGVIPPLQAERLRDIGAWLAVNGEAIYGSRAWIHPSVGQVRFTQGAEGELYAFVPPEAGEILLPASIVLPHNATVELLGTSEPLAWRAEPGALVITIPAVVPAIEGAPLVLRLGARLEGEPDAARERITESTN